MSFWDWYFIFVIFWVPVMMGLWGWYNAYTHEKGIIEPGSVYDHNGNYVYEDTMIESGIDPYPDESPQYVGAMLNSYINRHDLDISDPRVLNRTEELKSKFIKGRWGSGTRLLDDDCPDGYVALDDKCVKWGPQPSKFVIYEENPDDYEPLGEPNQEPKQELKMINPIEHHFMCINGEYYIRGGVNA